MWITWKDKTTSSFGRSRSKRKLVSSTSRYGSAVTRCGSDCQSRRGPARRRSRSAAYSATQVLPFSDVALAHFETIGKYRGLATCVRGAQFKAGAQTVFPLMRNVAREVRKKLLDILTWDARCGLYHNSRTRRGVGGSSTAKRRGDGLLSRCEQVLAISPERLPHALKGHLERYRAELLDSNNTDARQCFERQFDKDFGVN